MSKLSVTELQLKAAEEDRDTLRSDLENSEAGRDVLIKKAWETRDAAVKRKNNTEIELARTRIEDMQELLEEQMNRKMKQQQKGKSQGGGADSDSSQSQGERKRSKLFSFLKLPGST